MGESPTPSRFNLEKTAMKNPIQNVWDATHEKYSDEELNSLYLKANLCDSMEAYTDGIGEGIWAIPLDEDNKKLLDDDKKGTFAKIITFNNSLYFPALAAGSVVQVEIRPGNRPVLDINWMQEQLKDITDFKKDFLGHVEH